MNSCARRIAKSISFKRFVQEEIKLTEKLYEEAENFVTEWHQFKYKERKLLQVSLSLCKANKQISDGGKQLIFKRDDLPIHHFVAY